MRTDLLERQANTADDADSSPYARECDSVRQNIERTLQSAARSNKLLKNKDVEDYMKGISDAAMREGGADSYKTQLEWLRQNQLEFVPNMIQKAQNYAEKFFNAMNAAKREGILNTENVAHLENVLIRRSATFDQVKAFFETSEADKSIFDTWVENWKDIGEKLRQVNRLRHQAKLLKGSVPSVDKLDTPEFQNGKVVTRQAMLNAALEDLVNYEYANTALYAEARGHIARAVQGKAVAGHNAERLLAGIFGRYAGDKLQNFVRSDLPERINDWIVDSQTFLLQSANAKKAGIPVPGLAAYLEMGYRQRCDEIASIHNALRQAEKKSRHPVLAQVQEALQQEQFAKARQLANVADGMQLTNTDRRYLFDLTQEIDMELEAMAGATPDRTKGTPEEEVIKKRVALDREMRNLPRELFDYYAWALRQGGSKKWARLRRLRVWHYNVKWAHGKGFLPNEEALQSVVKGAARETEAHINVQGHSAKGVERVDLGKVNTKDVNVQRDLATGKARGATYNVYGREDIDKLQDAVNADVMDEKVNYWGLGVAKGVTLKRHLETYDPMARTLRELQPAEVAAGVQDESVQVGYGMAA